MDIRNILNAGDRRAVVDAGTCARERDKEPAPAAVLARPAAPELRPHPSEQPPQHVQIYNGPVYQLPPAVEVHHTANAIHYRYGAYSPFDERARAEYSVYQEYAELPRHPHANASGLYPAQDHRIAQTRNDYTTLSPLRPQPPPVLAGDAAAGPTLRPLPPPLSPRFHPYQQQLAHDAASPRAYQEQHHSGIAAKAHTNVLSQAENQCNARAVDVSTSRNLRALDESTRATAPGLQSAAQPSAHRPEPYNYVIDGHSIVYNTAIDHVSPPPQPPPPQPHVYHSYQFYTHPPYGPVPYHQTLPNGSHLPATDHYVHMLHPSNRQSPVYGTEQIPARPASAGRDRDPSIERHSTKRECWHVNGTGVEGGIAPPEPKRSRKRLVSNGRVREKAFPSSSTRHQIDPTTELSRDHEPQSLNAQRSSTACPSDAAKSEGEKDIIVIIDDSEDSNAEDKIRARSAESRPIGSRSESEPTAEADAVVEELEHAGMADDKDKRILELGECPVGIGAGGLKQRVAAKKRPRRAPKVPPKRIVDPDEPYPEVSSDFSGIPPTAIGDMIQLWDFVTAFSKTLRLSPFPLRSLELALIHHDRSPLLDACLVRLVCAILGDGDLVDELGLSDSVVSSITAKGSKNPVRKILGALPHILSFESDESDDHVLHAIVRKLANSPDRWAFYRVIDPAARLRILRELVDYATMSDLLRECVADSLEHADEERKKAREENVANRRKLDAQVKELRAELLEYRIRNGLIEAPAGEPDGKNELCNSARVNSPSENGDSNGSSAAMVTAEPNPVALSRQQKVLAAQRERKEVEERREKERGAEAIVAKIEKVRANLKTLRNVRLRNRVPSGMSKNDAADGASGEGISSLLAQGGPEQDPVRTYPLGIDREQRCYWFYQDGGRVWIEDTQSAGWSYLRDVSDVDALLKWLSPDRTEEASLKTAILKHMLEIVATMAKSAKDLELEAAIADSSDASPETVPRATRAGKRRAKVEKQKMPAKAKKARTRASFLEYSNTQA